MLQNQLLLSNYEVKEVFNDSELCLQTHSIDYIHLEQCPTPTCHRISSCKITMSPRRCLMSPIYAYKHIEFTTSISSIARRLHFIKSATAERRGGQVGCLTDHIYVYKQTKLTTFWLSTTNFYYSTTNATSTSLPGMRIEPSTPFGSSRLDPLHKKAAN